MRRMLAVAVLVACNGEPDETDPIDLGCDSLVVMPTDMVLVDDENSASFQVGFCNNYNAVQGDLDASLLDSLSGLSCLCEVQGDVVIHGTDATSLAGLEKLQRVGGSLRVSDNVQLTDLDALSALTSVGGDVEVTVNAGLTSVAGLAGLTRADGRLAVTFSPDLVDLTGLEGITEVTGDLDVTDTGVTSLAPLAALTDVGGAFSFVRNDAATTVDGLAITSLGGSLRVLENRRLKTLAGLGGITSVPGGVEIGGNYSLESLDGLALQTVVRDLDIRDNDVLADLDALSSLVTVGGVVRVTNNDALTSVTLPFTQLDTDVVITGNPSLITLSFPTLTALRGTLSVEDNAGLVDLGGMDAVTQITTLDVRHNPSLTRFVGFGLLTRIGLDLIIEDNDALGEVRALRGIESVGRDLRIVGNAVLPPVEYNGLRDAIGVANILGNVVIEDNG